MSRLIRLYPQTWRDRYEEELEGLLIEHPPTLWDRFDLVRCAVDAHRHPQIVRRDSPDATPERLDDLRVARRLGAGAVVGAAVWVAALVLAATGPVHFDSDGMYRDGSAAFPFVMLAIGLLIAGLVGQLIWLPRAARLARIGAGSAIPFLLLWAMGPWLWWFALMALVGVVALAVGGRRAGAWPTGAVLAVGVAVVVVAVAAASVSLAGSSDRMVTGPFFVLGLAGLLPAWLAVG